MEDLLTKPRWTETWNQPVDYAQSNTQSGNFTPFEKVIQISGYIPVRKPQSKDARFTRKTFKANPLQCVVTQDK